MAVCVERALANSTCESPHSMDVATFTTFGFPRGLRYLRQRPVLYEEVGRSHMQLAVSHTHTLQHVWQPGLWLYYMRGCSDLSWDVGRTMLVRNRCELAILLQQRSTPGSSRPDAIAHIVRTMQQVTANFSAYGLHDSVGAKLLLTSLGLIVGPPDQPWPASRVEAALDDCARGRLRSLRNRSDDSRERIVEHWLALNVLDYFSAALLAFVWPHQLDTVQFTNQCDEAASSADMLTAQLCINPIEIWDVRTLHLDLRRQLAPLNAHARALLELGQTFSTEAHLNQLLANLPKPWGRIDADGTNSSCELSADWMACVACKGSTLALACAFKCTQARHSSKSRYSPGAEGQLLYGQRINPANGGAWMSSTHNPLSKALAWMPMWAGLLRKFADAWMNTLGRAESRSHVHERALRLTLRTLS